MGKGKGIGILIVVSSLLYVRVCGGLISESESESSEGLILLSFMSHWTSAHPSLYSSWKMNMSNHNNSSSTPPYCSWVGIRCNKHDASVISVNLSSCLISGRLGPELARLPHLTSLDLSYNYLSGPIPPIPISIHYLDLSSNFLTGPIPPFLVGNSLTYLYLSGNSLTGSIPPHIANLTLLQEIDFSSNHLTGNIPPHLTTLPNLRLLSLYDNSLYGSIPSSFHSPYLQAIYLSSNQLTGPISPVLTTPNLTNLLDLHLDNNLFSASIPSSIATRSLQTLRIANNRLTGHLPTSLIQGLPHLTTLDLHNNTLQGTIHLNCNKALVYLDLSFNQFHGPLPHQLGNCSSLNQFAAVNCGLTGSIPSSLGKLTAITTLHLSLNHLSGNIPPELGNCKSLVHLELQSNQLEGSIPDQFGMLSQLQVLKAFDNRLTGEVPLGIWRIKGLKILQIYDNNLSGELPDEVAQMTQLREITLFNNRFTGPIPQGLGINNSFLTVIDFTNNSFTGKIPPSLCFRKQLQKLLLGFNQLQGSVPPDVGTCSSLSRLILQHNNLTGVLPEFMENQNMLYMNLRSNSFDGDIPASFAKLTNITLIDLSINKLSGQIPLELGNLVQLQALNISYNQLAGPLPPQLGNCSRLLEFDASHNLLNGSIPPTFDKLTQLSTISLSDNHFSGGIPPFISRLHKLTDLQLGGNSLGGSIPSLIVELQNLNRLNLSSNNLIGVIPTHFGKLVMLEHLDVSHNNLTGTLAPLNEAPGLVTLNVSYNHFTGPIPAILLRSINITNSSFLGNAGLCVDCGLSCLRNNNNFKPCVVRSRNQKRLNKQQYVMIGVGVCLFVMVVFLVLYLVVICHRKQKQEMEMLAEVGSLLIKVMEATENLDDKYVIGRGAHGTVYKASLGHDRVYAVKKIGFGGVKGEQTSMKRELETVGKVRHRNLVTIQDVLIRKDCGLILYKYMENGSLHDVLHEKKPPLSLSWSIRYRIALGTAQGLAYLHFDCDPVIVHRDIKPMNILLDGDMEPHISDFGIAKLLDQTAACSTSTLMGTIGYMAPENAFGRSKSRESDVYSYGVVLLELISRQKVDIVSWVRSRWSETQEIERIVDGELLEEVEEDAMVREQVTKVVLLALRCTDSEPTRRPSMREVVNCL